MYIFVCVCTLARKHACSSPVRESIPTAFSFIFFLTHAFKVHVIYFAWGLPLLRKPERGSASFVRASTSVLLFTLIRKPANLGKKKRFYSSLCNCVLYIYIFVHLDHRHGHNNLHVLLHK